MPAESRWRWRWRCIRRTWYGPTAASGCVGGWMGGEGVGTTHGCTPQKGRHQWSLSTVNETAVTKPASYVEQGRPARGRLAYVGPDTCQPKQHSFPSLDRAGTATWRPVESSFALRNRSSSLASHCFQVRLCVCGPRTLGCKRNKPSFQYPRTYRLSGYHASFGNSALTSGPLRVHHVE
ncbi:uncharacterized protein IWZ02DRAFT_180620 [Phyllosticta citriasiana]|uniref:uncharacterized protein n=1 Tax=Phyllosticta citriasiana TaxID=595635 RepID=UPI0030FDB239